MAIKKIEDLFGEYRFFCILAVQTTTNMKYFTANGPAADLKSAISEVSKWKAPKKSAGETHEAVIAMMSVSERRMVVGIQYFTHDQITSGSRKNDDGTVSVYLKHL